MTMFCQSSLMSHSRVRKCAMISWRADARGAARASLRTKVGVEGKGAVAEDPIMLSNLAMYHHLWLNSHFLPHLFSWCRRRPCRHFHRACHPDFHLRQAQSSPRIVQRTIAEGSKRASARRELLVLSATHLTTCRPGQITVSISRTKSPAPGATTALGSI